MATYSFEGKMAAEARIRGRAPMWGRLVALGGIGARIQQRAMLQVEAAQSGEASHNRPATATPRLQTVESKVEWRS